MRRSHYRWITASPDAIARRGGLNPHDFSVESEAPDLSPAERTCSLRTWLKSILFSPLMEPNQASHGRRSNNNGL